MVDCVTGIFLPTLVFFVGGAKRCRRRGRLSHESTHPSAPTPMPARGLHRLGARKCLDRPASGSPKKCGKTSRRRNPGGFHPPRRPRQRPARPSGSWCNVRIANGSMTRPAGRPGRGFAAIAGDGSKCSGRADMTPTWCGVRDAGRRASRVRRSAASATPISRFTNGVWFDADELTQMLAWVRSGGLEAARDDLARLRDSPDKVRRRAVQNRDQGLSPRPPSRSAMPVTGDSERPGIGALLGGTLESTPGVAEVLAWIFTKI